MLDDFAFRAFYAFDCFGRGHKVNHTAVYLHPAHPSAVGEDEIIVCAVGLCVAKTVIYGGISHAVIAIAPQTPHRERVDPRVYFDGVYFVVIVEDEGKIFLTQTAVNYIVACILLLESFNVAGRVAAHEDFAETLAADDLRRAFGFAVVALYKLFAVPIVIYRGIIAFKMCADSNFFVVHQFVGEFVALADEIGNVLLVSHHYKRVLCLKVCESGFRQQILFGCQFAVLVEIDIELADVFGVSVAKCAFFLLLVNGDVASVDVVHTADSGNGIKVIILLVFKFKRKFQLAGCVGRLMFFCLWVE